MNKTLEKIETYLSKMDEKKKITKYFNFINDLMEDIDKEDYKDVNLAIQEKLQEEFSIEEDESKNIFENWQKLHEGDEKSL